MSSPRNSEQLNTKHSHRCTLRLCFYAWNKGKRCGQHRYQSRIRNAEDRKCEKDHCAENQHLDALAGKELCIGVVRQFCNVADALCRWLLEVSAQKTTALSAKLTAAQQHVEHDHDCKHSVYCDRDC